MGVLSFLCVVEKDSEREKRKGLGYFGVLVARVFVEKKEMEEVMIVGREIGSMSLWGLALYGSSVCLL